MKKKTQLSVWTTHMWDEIYDEITPNGTISSSILIFNWYIELNVFINQRVNQCVLPKQLDRC